jgi:hypothetical protein
VVVHFGYPCGILLKNCNKNGKKLVRRAKKKKKERKEKFVKDKGDIKSDDPGLLRLCPCGHPDCADGGIDHFTF